MTYSTVMVHLDPDQSNDACLNVAGDLAEQFDARLIGIAACQPQPSSVYAYGAFAQTLVRQLEEEANEKLEKLEQRFRSAYQNRIEHVEWRHAYAVPVDFVAREARAADIVVTGSDRGVALSDPLWRLDPSELVMNLGRPMMVVPPDIDRLKLTRVVIGWKDTRESRRAVADALPLLQRVKEVTIAEIVDDDTFRASAGGRVADVAAWLGRHQVDAGHVVLTQRGDTVEQLVRQASDIDADMIVAGAYGHTRMREWVFGGVTRDLITKSDRCTLLSH